MRPFKFFFVLSLGILLFFFIGRFLLMALAGAVLLSLAFFLFRKARYFFHHLSWDGQHYRDEPNYPRLLTEPEQDEVPFFEFDREARPQSDWQIIRIQ